MLATTRLQGEWRMHGRSPEVHITPVNDIRPHIDSPQCPCGPKEDEQAPGLFIHHSYDGRENMPKRVQ